MIFTREGTSEFLELLKQNGIEKRNNFKVEKTRPSKIKTTKRHSIDFTFVALSVEPSLKIRVDVTKTLP